MYIPLSTFDVMVPLLFALLAYSIVTSNEIKRTLDREQRKLQAETERLIKLEPSRRASRLSLAYPSMYKEWAADLGEKQLGERLQSLSFASYTELLGHACAGDFVDCLLRMTEQPIAR